MSWEVDRRLSEASIRGEHPAIAAANGRVYVAWHRPRGDTVDVVLRRSPDRGQRFASAVTLSASGAAAHASLAADGDYVHLVWGDTRTGTAEVYARSSADAGAHWAAEARISEEPYASWVPSVAAWNNLVWVAWVDYRDANEEEYVRRSRDGGRSWDPPVRVTGHPADSWAPSIATAGSRGGTGSTGRPIRRSV